jgi:hypothetical protein
MRAFCLFPALAFAAACLGPLAGAAQAVSQTVEEAVDIPLEEWVAMAMGRTLTYRIGGELWAMERYVPGTNEVMLQFRDGTCLTGTWEYSAPHYCFHWDGEGTSCFRHARAGEEILILETVGGIDTGAVQTMTDVSDTPLTCGPAVVS